MEIVCSIDNVLEYNIINALLNTAHDGDNV